MCSDKVVIEVRGVAKNYQIYRRPQDRLKQSMLPRIQRLFRVAEKRYFREFEALKNISLTIRKGETVGIVGSNGSGKSTLLQVICGILVPSRGEVVTRGQVAALLELGTGFNPEFSGIENVYLYGQILGLTPERIEELLPAILEFADIGDFVYQPVKTYSSGMVVRLAFAVSVVREPDILVVDEALAVGDEAFQRKCYARLEEMRRRETTILFVSHGANIVVSLCDRALLIDRGELLFDGHPKDTIALYHKIAFAPAVKREAIKREIRQLTPVARLDNAEDDLKTPIKVNKSFDEAFFAPQFVSKSRMEYEPNGALIENPRLMTLAGKEVNHLIHGEEYIYTYSVRFLRASKDVRFGMLIKTIAGVEIGGAAFPTVDRGAEHINQGLEFKPRFRFRCLFNPGSYLLNAGVMGIQDGSKTYLHRLVDVIIFKVLPVEGRIATGFINFDVEASTYPALVE